MMKISSRSKWMVLSLVPVLLVIAVAVVSAQEQPAKPDEFSAAVGQQTFRTYCASCHGESGHGDGNVAEYLRVKPANLTLIKKENGGYFPFQTVVQIIDGRVGVKGHGQGEMPIWGDAFKRTGGGKTEEEVAVRIEQLAHYLWSIQED